MPSRKPYVGEADETQKLSTLTGFLSLSSQNLKMRLSNNREIKMFVHGLDRMGSSLHG